MTAPGAGDRHAITRGYVDSPEGQMHYRQAGAGPATVLIHQGPGSSAMWIALLPLLAAMGRRAVAFDLPGLGMSDPPPTEPDLAYYAYRVADAAQRLGLETFDVVGHHTGAFIGLWLANAYPDRVRSLVGYGLALLDAKTAAELAHQADPDYSSGPAEVVSWWNSFAQVIPADQAATLIPRYMADMLLTGATRAYAHRAVGRADHAGALAALRVPTLAVAGRREFLFDATRAAAACSDHIRFHELGDAGIFVVDEYPAQFARLINDFLGETAT
jgi:pimeloyl-ACP methyl ester carboxylesterase